MDWNVIIDFIRPELFLLVIFLWCAGAFLKLVPWFKAEWMIPFVLWGIGLIMTIVYMAIVAGSGFTAVVIVTGIIQATLIAALAVFGNELIKQVTVKRKEDAA